MEVTNDLGIYDELIKKIDDNKEDMTLPESQNFKEAEEEIERMWNEDRYGMDDISRVMMALRPDDKISIDKDKGDVLVQVETMIMGDDSPEINKLPRDWGKNVGEPLKILADDYWWSYQIMEIMGRYLDELEAKGDKVDLYNGMKKVEGLTDNILRGLGDVEASDIVIAKIMVPVVQRMIRNKFQPDTSEYIEMQIIRAYSFEGVADCLKKWGILEQKNTVS